MVAAAPAERRMREALQAAASFGTYFGTYFILDIKKDLGLKPKSLFYLVGAERFELSTPTTPCSHQRRPVP